jgi:hypothetical protein
VTPIETPSRPALPGSDTPIHQHEGGDVDPNPDYDASDEIEYFFNWLPRALRGVYPPPAYPPV